VIVGKLPRLQLATDERHIVVAAYEERLFMV
jgi:hypothetical protein